ncbi:hypothetical protein [Cognatishimia sp. MH4019]|uniref:hypothetical protein n=1 Tax=Cognatishimia sp. MH4019 TaxID=2854030 RepID=UPI001CD39347|nr:hypothetical protein [Cognatishimia sp. MH4019]
MDPLTLIFYAVVCAVLSLFAPKLGGRGPRLAVGAAVGVLAATALPYLAAMVYGG